MSDVAIARTRSEPISDRARFFALLDSAHDFGYSFTLIAESDNPGSRDSLIVYCALHSIMIECGERDVGLCRVKYWRAELPSKAVVEVQINA